LKNQWEGRKAKGRVQEGSPYISMSLSIAFRHLLVPEPNTSSLSSRTNYNVSNLNPFLSNHKIYLYPNHYQLQLQLPTITTTRTTNTFRGVHATNYIVEVPVL
jgi:hypothetical protein